LTSLRRLGIQELFGLVAVLSAVACSGDGGTIPADQVTITAPTAPVAAGDTATIGVVVRDGSGQPSGAPATDLAVSTTLGTVTAPVRGADGGYSVQLTSTKVGTAVVTARLRGRDLPGSASVVFVPGSPSGMTSQLTVDRSSAAAGETVHVSVALLDRFGNGLTSGGSLVALTTTLGTLGDVVDQGDGTYAAPLAAAMSGTATVKATVGGAPIASTATVTFGAVMASPETSVMSASADALEADGEATATITVRLADALGILIRASGGAVAMSASAGTLSPVVDHLDGSYTATFTAPRKLGTALLQAALGGVPLKASASIRLVAGAPAGLVKVSGDAQSATAGTAVSPQVKVTDRSGNPVSGALVTFAVATGGGNVAVPFASTGDDGTAATAWTLGPRAGANALAASSGALAPVTFTATGVPGPAARLAFTRTPATTPANVPLTVQVGVVDGFGNVVRSNASVSLALASNPAGATLEGVRSVVAAEGLATFADVRIARAGSGYTLAATAPGLETAVSAPFNVTLGGLAGFFIEAAGGGAIVAREVGVPFEVRITARDAAGNVIPSFNGTVSVSSTGTLSMGAGTTAPFNAGLLGSHRVAFAAAGTFTLTASDGGLETTSDPFVIDARPVVTATVPADGASNVAAAAPITVTFSEPVQAPSGAFTLICGGASRSFTASGSPGTTITLTPAAALPAKTRCTVTVLAAMIADADASDPPDQPAADRSFSFTVVPPAPTLVRLTPAEAFQGTTVAALLAGTDFVPGATTVSVSGTGVTADLVSVGSDLQSLTARISVAVGAPVGPRDVTVTTPGGTSGPLTFTVGQVSATSIASFTSSGAAVLSVGQATLLSWATTGAASCSIDHGVGGVPCNGSVAAVPGASLVYTLTATGGAGTVTRTTSVTLGGPGRFLYVANMFNNQVGMYTINGTTGALAPIGGGTVAAGNIPMGVAVDPEGRFAYVSNFNSSTISAYTINGTTGALTANGIVVTGSGPRCLAVDPSARFLYVINQLDDTISSYTIAGNGQLTANGGTVATGGQPLDITADPTGRFVFVANFSGNSVSRYTIGADGQLTLQGSTATGGSPAGVTVHPSGAYVYVGNRGGLSVSMFSLGPAAALTSLGANATASSGPFQVAADPTGQYVYAAGAQTDEVEGFTVAGGGTLASVGTFAAGAQVAGIAVDQEGKFVYATNNTDGNISAYAIGAGGTLTPVPGSPFAAGTVPMGIVVSR
jgi:adhesin/invasin